jgi:DNA-directed RNA polymerase specialized sigma24 family protein
MMDLKEVQRLIDVKAHKVARRLLAAGAPSHLIEDVKQEMWIAFCMARDTYDDSRGASFKTYLWRGIDLHLNNWTRDNVNRRHAEIIARSLDAELGDEGGATLLDTLPSADPATDTIVAESDMWRFTMSKLKPRTRQFLEILNSPPALLVEQVRQLQARSAHAKAQGMTLPTTNRVTTTMVFDLMEATRSERHAIAKEIEKVTAKVQRATRA